MLRRHASLFGSILALAGAVLLYGPLESAARRSGIVRSESATPQGTKTELDVTLDEFFITRMTGAFRGIFINALWMRAIAAERNYEWYKLKTLYKRISMLQPRYPDVWVSNTDNLAFQLSWDPETPKENWAFIREALDFGEEGFRKNPDDARIPLRLALVYDQKIGKTEVYDPDTNKGPYYYRDMLWKDRKEKYSEQTIKWLETAFRMENCPLQVIGDLWEWYNLFRYRAVGAADTAAEQGYRKRLEDLAAKTLSRPGYERPYVKITRILPYALSLVAPRMKRMVTDLAFEEEQDQPESWWAWINGALQMAADRLAGHLVKKGQETALANIYLATGRIYFYTIHPDKTFRALLERDRGERDCLALARRNFETAHTWLKAAEKRVDEIQDEEQREKFRVAVAQRILECDAELKNLADEEDIK